MIPPKETNKSPIPNPDEMEIYELPDKVFQNDPLREV